MKTIQGTRTTVTVGSVELVIGWTYEIPSCGVYGILCAPLSENEGDILYLELDKGPEFLIDSDGAIYRTRFVFFGDDGQYAGFSDEADRPRMFVDGHVEAEGDPIGHVTDLVLV